MKPKKLYVVKVSDYPQQPEIYRGSEKQELLKAINKDHSSRKKNSTSSTSCLLPRYTLLSYEFCPTFDGDTIRVTENQINGTCTKKNLDFHLQNPPDSDCVKIRDVGNLAEFVENYFIGKKE